MRMRPEFQALRNFVDTASNNPLAFHKKTSASAIAHDSKENMSMSNDFVQKQDLGQSTIEMILITTPSFKLQVHQQNIVNSH